MLDFELVSSLISHTYFVCVSVFERKILTN